MPRVASHLVTVAQLALLGVVGPVVLTTLGTMLVLGVAGIPLLGTGLIMLAALAFAVFAFAAVERLRARGILGDAVPLATWRTSRRRDWLRWPATIGLQLVDPANLKALLHLVVATALGLLALGAWWVVGFGVVAAFAPLAHASPVPDLPVTLAWWPAIGIGLVLVGALTLLGLSFAHRAATTMLLVPSREAELTQRARAASQQREGAVRAAELERTRIERDLHDGVQPRLVSIAMTLGMARGRIQADPEGAARLVDEAHASTKAAITELRQLARGIHTAVLDDRGLDAALSALAARSHIPVDLDVRLQTRPPHDAETAMYFVVAEALTNAAKHAHADRVRVVLRDGDGVLRCRVEDDGVGGARRVPGGGIDGIAHRVLAAGGTFVLDSPREGPTAVEVTIPCAS